MVSGVPERKDLTPNNPGRRRFSAFREQTPTTAGNSEAHATVQTNLSPGDVVCFLSTPRQQQMFLLI